MKQCRLAWIACVALSFITTYVLAQEFIEDTVPVSDGKPAIKALAFPLSTEDSALSPDILEATINDARENDVDVTIPNALLYKGLQLFQDEEYDECIPFIEEALRRQPSSPSGWEALGWAYIRTGRPERGRALWVYFQALMPNHWMPYNLLAQDAVMHHDWKMADEMLQETLKRNPELFDQRYWYAQNLLRLGRSEEGEAIFRRLIAREPGRLDIQIDLANILTHRFAYDESVKIWRHVNAELDGNPEFMMNQAELEFMLGELKTAESLCSAVLEIEPENRRALTLRVDLADSADNSPESVKRLEALIDETEDSGFRSELEMRLARRCQALNEYTPDAFSDSHILGIIEQAIKDDGCNLTAMIVYAEQCVLMKRFRQAKRWAKYILEHFNRNNIRAKDVLFEVALGENRFDDAEQILIDRYDNSDPTDPTRLRNMARVQMGRGEFQAAMDCLDMLEASALRGSVLTLMYRNLTESDWMPQTSVRRLREHMNALKRAGFIMVAPTNLPSIAGLKLGESSAADLELGNGGNKNRAPLLARTLDSIWYQLSGEHYFKTNQLSNAEDQPLKKYFAVTFDGGLMSSFILGDKVAGDFGVPFGMFVDTEPRKEYEPSVAGWETIRRYVTNGNWIVGSQLYMTHKLMPVNADGTVMRRGLVNRVWLSNRGRLESMNEWDERMRYEFRHSREVLKEEMGTNDSFVSMVAYPFGDVGQDESCNLSALRNSIPTITTEASRDYAMAYLQGSCGYTSVGDNLFLARRYEPRWNDEGADLLRAVSDMHPVFMARRAKIDLAMHMNRPHTAEKLIRLLKRDGYPEDALREIQAEVNRHFRGIPNRKMNAVVSVNKAIARDDDGEIPTVPVDLFDPDIDPDAPGLADNNEIASGAHMDASGKHGDAQEASGEVNEGKVEGSLFRPHDPFVGATLSQTKAIDQFEYGRIAINGGFKINESSSISAEFGFTPIDQKFRARWNNVTNDNKAVDYHSFSATREDLRFRFAHLLESGAIFSTSLGFVNMSFDIDPDETKDLEDEVGDGKFYDPIDGSIPVYDISISWKTRNDTGLRMMYGHDVLTIAAKLIKYDTFLGQLNWKPIDTLDVETKAQYWAYSDDNAMFNILSSGYYDFMPQQGYQLGCEVMAYSTSRACDYYWTPYWDERVYGVFRYKRQYQGYNFRIDFITGLQREDERPLRRSLDAGLSGASDWGYIWGLRSFCEYWVDDDLSFTLDLTIMALREYIDHQLVLGVNFQF